MTGPTYSHDAKDSVGRGSERIARTALRRGEQLGRKPVEHRVHDVAAEAEGAVPSQQSVALESRGRAVEENTGKHREDGQGSLAADAGNLHEVPSQQRTRYAQHGDDQAVAVGNVRAAIAKVNAPSGLNVRQEGVVQRVAQANEAPDNHDDGGAEGKAARGKEWLDLVNVELLQPSLDCGGGISASDVSLGLTCLEIVNGQGRRLAIAAGNFVNDPDSFLVAALAHQVLGRLKNGEANESHHKHEEGKTAHRNDEIAPAHVLTARTVPIVLAARQAAQQGPSDQRSHDLSDGPIDGQDRQQVLVGAWQELEEDGRVDGEVAADAKGPEGGKDADGSKVGGAGSNHAPDGGKAQGQVKTPFATKDIATEAPEYGSGEETNVLSECQQRSARREELVADGRKDERGDDGPQVVASPSETDDNEELPLVPSHTDILDLQVVCKPL